MELYSQNTDYKLFSGSMLDMLERFPENAISSIVTDPPYELGFMGKSWDNAGVSFQKETWEKCLKVLKPGGYLLAFGGTRTYHRIACAIEDAGFEIRDCIMWLYGSGFPKSMNIGLAVDKKNGVESKIVGISKTSAPDLRDVGKKSKESIGIDKLSFGQVSNAERKFTEIKEAQNEWNGWGTCLKPAYEPIIVARKPFKGTLVDNVMTNGVGGYNIDECRIETNGELIDNHKTKGTPFMRNAEDYEQVDRSKSTQGRFPANLILTYGEEDKEEVCGGMPIGGRNGSITKRYDMNNTVYGKYGQCNTWTAYNDEGSASRYFYCAKASKKDRDEGLDKKNIHPTVKPTSLMQYLVRLVSPKGAIILDPFMGSGSTGKAVMYENKERNAGYKFIGIEKEIEYCEIAQGRIEFAKNNLSET